MVPIPLLRTRSKKPPLQIGRVAFVEAGLEAGTAHQLGRLLRRIAFDGGCLNPSVGEFEVAEFRATVANLEDSSCLSDSHIRKARRRSCDVKDGGFGKNTVSGYVELEVPLRSQKLLWCTEVVFCIEVAIADFDNCLAGESRDDISLGRDAALNALSRIGKQAARVLQIGVEDPEFHSRFCLLKHETLVPNFRVGIVDRYSDVKPRPGRSRARGAK
jgi:hypothetical protein